MKKIIIGFFPLIVGLVLAIGGVQCVCAQEGGVEEFTLEEITVTAEKREVNVQDIPASVEAITGADLMEQGKITTSQMLEDIPNVVLAAEFRNVGVMVGSPDAGITIRGVQFKQTSDGQPPAASATYVDGVFQGFGGNFDIDRIEVLRGPQGTLYGRSATGGVVNFITKNPRLGEFGFDGFVEWGEASLKNVQAAINIPASDFFAMRAAAHYFEADGYHNPDGGWYGTREGRIKALFKPSEALDVLLNLTVNERKNNSGGYAARLTSPTTIDYQDTWDDVVEGVWRQGTMGALTVNYDFGESIMTYIGAMRYYEDLESPPQTMINPGRQIMHNQFFNYGEHFKTHELRLASDWDASWDWLIGSFYYDSDYKRTQNSVNHIAYDRGVVDPNPATQDAPIFQQPVEGDITNFGIFTEENFELSDVFRITAGLRYDHTENHAYAAFNMNVNETPRRDPLGPDPGGGNALNPPIWVFFPYEDTLEWDNITYKLRFEYDLTPDNTLYFLTATGFQPGDIRITNKMGPEGIVMFELPYDEEKLTSYEVGSKNRFLDNTLQLNVSAFYYDYEGFRHTVNTAVAGPPVYTIITTPLRMYGTEMDIQWLVTAKDKVSFSVGALDAKITGFPDIPEFNPTSQYLALEKLPRLPDLTANLGYDHVFTFADGSTLVPRAEMRYTSDMYVDQLMDTQVALGLLPYAYQDSYIITDIGATWTSASDKYALTGYIRNVFDEEYKTEVNFGGGVNAVGVTAGDPRVFGLMFRARF